MPEFQNVCPGFEMMWASPHSCAVNPPKAQRRSKSESKEAKGVGSTGSAAGGRGCNAASTHELCRVEGLAWFVGVVASQHRPKP